MSQDPEAPDPTRRTFLKLVTAAGAAAALPHAAAALAQGAPAAPAPTTTPATGAATPPPPTTPEASAPAISEDARALAAVLRRRVKAQLSDAQWEAVARDFDGDLALGKRLRALKLANGDEPDSTFKV